MQIKKLDISTFFSVNSSRKGHLHGFVEATIRPSECDSRNTHHPSGVRLYLLRPCLGGLFVQYTSLALILPYGFATVRQVHLLAFLHGVRFVAYFRHKQLLMNIEGTRISWAVRAYMLVSWTPRYLLVMPPSSNSHWTVHPMKKFPVSLLSHLLAVKFF